MPRSARRVALSIATGASRCRRLIPAGRRQAQPHMAARASRDRQSTRAGRCTYSSPNAPPLDGCHELRQHPHIDLDLADLQFASQEPLQSLHADGCAHGRLLSFWRTSPPICARSALRAPSDPAAVICRHPPHVFDRFRVIRVAGNIAMRSAGLRIFWGVKCCRI